MWDDNIFFKSCYFTLENIYEFKFLIFKINILQLLPMLMIHVDHLYQIFYHIDHNEAKIIFKNFTFKINITKFTFCSTRPSGGAFGISI